MRTFKDRDGQEWEIDLTFGEVMRIKNDSGEFDLLDPITDDLSQRLDVDLAAFWEVLLLVTEPQAKERGITPERFGKIMAGNCLVEAQRQFFAEWTDFFRQIQRPDVARALDVTAQLRAKAVEVVTRRIKADRSTVGLSERAEASLDRELTKSFSALQASLDSILPPTPGADSGTATKGY